MRTLRLYTTDVKLYSTQCDSAPTQHTCVTAFYHMEYSLQPTCAIFLVISLVSSQTGIHRFPVQRMYADIFC